MKIELMWRSTARFVITGARQSLRCSALGDQGEDLLLTRSECVEVGVGAGSLRGQEQLDNARVDDRSPRGHLAKRAGEVPPVLHPILEQICAAN